MWLGLILDTGSKFSALKVLPTHSDLDVRVTLWEILKYTEISL